MVNFITKKDGTREAFDSEKIRHAVTQAALEAEISEAEAEKIAHEILDFLPKAFEGVEEATTEEVREKVLTELDATHPTVAESWRNYDEGKHE